IPEPQPPPSLQRSNPLALSRKHHAARSPSPTTTPAPVSHTTNQTPRSLRRNPQTAPVFTPLAAPGAHWPPRNKQKGTPAAVALTPEPTTPPKPLYPNSKPRRDERRRGGIDHFSRRAAAPPRSKSRRAAPNSHQPRGTPTQPSWPTASPPPPPPSAPRPHPPRPLAPAQRRSTAPSSRTRRPPRRTFPPPAEGEGGEVRGRGGRVQRGAAEGRARGHQGASQDDPLPSHPGPSGMA
ncbi:unnamed protein product, partial [Urochloa humidicola]